jgi:hypothetical protein
VSAGHSPPPVSGHEPEWHSSPHRLGADAGQPRHTPPSQLVPAGQQVSPHTVSPAGQRHEPKVLLRKLVSQAAAVRQQVVLEHAAGNSAGHVAQKKSPPVPVTERTQLSPVRQH